MNHLWIPLGVLIVDAAALIGRPDPTGEPCSCPCTTQPGPDRTHTTTSPVVPCTKETP